MSNAIARYRELHQSGCFVLPNPWDVGSALYLAHLGAKALATTSGGVAFARGLPDGPGGLGKADMLAHFRELAAATPLPINADFQNGYADAPDDVAANVTECVASGVAGLSIEDNTGRDDVPLYPHDLAVERIRAARAAIDATGTGVVLTARCEAWLVGTPDAHRVVMARLTAFAEAGADCVYAPGIRDPRQIAELVRAVAPLPVNVLRASPLPGLSFAEVAALGVRRVSVGSGLARAAWGGFARAARSLITDGSFDGMTGALPFGELNALFAGRTS